MDLVKYQLFLDEIVSVCKKHGLVIATSDYDNLEVWPLEEHSLKYLAEADFQPTELD